MVWCDQHQFNQFKGATMIAAADSEEEKADDTDITFMDQGGRSRPCVTAVSYLDQRRIWKTLAEM